MTNQFYSLIALQAQKSLRLDIVAGYIADIPQGIFNLPPVLLWVIYHFVFGILLIHLVVLVLRLQR